MCDKRTIYTYARNGVRSLFSTGALYYYWNLVDDVKKTQHTSLTLKINMPMNFVISPNSRWNWVVEHITHPYLNTISNFDFPNTTTTPNTTLGAIVIYLLLEKKSGDSTPVKNALNWLSNDPVFRWPISFCTKQFKSRFTSTCTSSWMILTVLEPTEGLDKIKHTHTHTRDVSTTALVIRMTFSNIR